MIHTLFIDLDNTIYPKSCGLMDAIRHRIVLYMREELGLEEPEISEIRHSSVKKYGTTLLGLKERFEINEFDYLDYVHNINLDEHLIKDDRLKIMLESYPQRKIIFTNADKKHVNRVLEFLEINIFFDQVIDVHCLMPKLKPNQHAYQRAIEIADLPSWEDCAFIDDYPDNIIQARKMGIFSILIDEKSQFQDDLSIRSIYDLPKIIPVNP